MKSYKADYVIVGTGSAGCVLANVLSSDKKTSVISLEAGQYENDNEFLNMPQSNVPDSPQYFWSGVTLPDLNTDGISYDWTNGRVLGGGSSINGQLAVKSQPATFDEWERIAGPFWSARKVYKTYKKMESLFGPVTDPQNHGYQGEQAIRVGIPDSNQVDNFINAVKASGVPGSQTEINDYNNPDTPIGPFRNWQYFQFPDGTRASAARCFLNDSVINEDGVGQNGRKLLVLTQTTGTRLVWKGKKVKGVIALHNGIPIKIKANKKVIVSCGFNSSAFLQYNGVGPADTLEKAGVEVKVELANVGREMKNYYYLTALLLAPPNATLNSNPATYNIGGAWLPDPRPGYTTKLRTIELTGLFLPEAPGVNILVIVVESPIQPKSNGSINIQDADPLKIAAADIGFLNDPADLASSAAAYQYVIAPMYEYLIAQGYYPLSPSLATIQDTAALNAFIQGSIGNGHHYIHFNKMAPKEDGGVVDSYGNVYGAENLMVVDASIFPSNVSGNTNFPSEMVAFRIAHHLLKSDKSRC